MRQLALAIFFLLGALALGWALGGQALLGRIDPALTIPTLLLPALLVMRQARRDSGHSRSMLAALSGLLLIMVQAWLSGALAGSVAPMQLGVTAVAAALALLLAHRFWQRRKRRAGRRGVALALAMLLVLLWFAGSHILLSQLYAPRGSGVRPPPLVVMSSLPLRWGGANDIKAAVQQGVATAPALARLEADFSVSLVDSLSDRTLPGDAVLLLAHPRALAPADLVAIDTFVRSGGRAVLLADALSGWPVDFPLGDARNPPVTSLLTPLLDHWGVTLRSADMADQKPVAVDLDGQRVALFSAGAFDRLPPGCQAYAARRIADCPVGAGRAWLVGDADLLFAPLWQTPVAGAAHLRRADTIEWLESLIGGDSYGGRAILHPQWIRLS